MGVGLQIEGIVEKLEGEENKNANDLYFSRQFPYGKVLGEFKDEFEKLINQNVYSFYKISPTTVWMNNPNAKSDERVKIDLKA